MCVWSSSLEEECLAQGAVRFVGGVEPLADTGNVELVLAVPALHRGNGSVIGVQHTVADVALLDSGHFLVNVALPQQNS
jgi:hypothetical protein